MCAIALALFIFCCIKSRRAGHKERMLADQEWEKHEMEMAMLKKRMRDDADDDLPMRGYDQKNIAVAHGRYL